jgi:pimeloyl-ACP methyl ester carboxylesterase
MQLFTSKPIALGRAIAVAIIGGSALLAALLAMSGTARAQPPATKPTVVLVHGAFAESASWNRVATRLLGEGYPVVAVANPLRGVASDAAYVAAVLRSIDGPVILVGHSYGGMVISNAATDNVKALVYVAGFAPEQGENALALSGKFPGSTLGGTLAPPVELADGNKDLFIQQEKFHAQFAADVSAQDAAQMGVAQRPITEAALNGPAAAPAWKRIPSWFLYGSLDKNIPAALHSFMAQRAGSKRTVEIKGASHVVMISHPQPLARLIDEAAAATVK